MLIDATTLESCDSIQQILELCVEPMKRLLTHEEQNEIKAIVREDDKQLISDLGAKKVEDAREVILEQYLNYHLTSSAKAVINYVYRDEYEDDEAFFLVGNYYLTVIEYAIQLVRQSLLNKSISANGNGTIKAISSNGRNVTFMNCVEAIAQSELPLALKQRLPKPKAKVRVW